MPETPSSRWQADVAREAVEVAAGRTPVGEAYAAMHYPPALTDATEAVLQAFAAGVSARPAAGHDELWPLIERVVTELNRVNEDFDESAFETEEREQLCAYIDATLHEAGVDVAALAASRGLHTAEITDAWREW